MCYSRAISSLDIGNFLGIPHSFFDDFSLYSNVYINFLEYINETAGKYYHLDIGLCHSNKLAPCLLPKGYKLLRYE